MARRDSVCCDCRSENLKLFLKGDRCFTDKCAYERRAYPPGQHGQRRRKFSEFAVQLREKQKVKKLYGLSEEQFRLYIKKAEKKKGITGENLLSSLETRLEEVVYRLGFAVSKKQARQLVIHHHFRVNGKKASVPSFALKQGDIVEVREKSQKLLPIQVGLDAIQRREMPQWLELDAANFKGTVKLMPSRSDVTVPIKENLIVEFYSR